MDSDILERAIAAVVAVETGQRTSKRVGRVAPAAAVEARIDFARPKRRFVVTVPRRGTADLEPHVATTDVPVGPDDATREVEPVVCAPAVANRLVVTIPRALLEPLFGNGLPGLSAETELAEAFTAFAVAVCEHVIKAAHGVGDFELAPPVVEPTTIVAPSAIAIGVLDQWIAAELVEDSLTGVRPLPKLGAAR